MKIKNPNLHLKELKRYISKEACNKYTEHVYCEKRSCTFHLGICVSRKLGYAGSRFGFLHRECKKCNKINFFLLKNLKEGREKLTDIVVGETNKINLNTGE